MLHLYDAKAEYLVLIPILTTLLDINNTIIIKRCYNRQRG